MLKKTKLITNTIIIADMTVCEKVKNVKQTLQKYYVVMSHDTNFCGIRNF